MHTQPARAQPPNHAEMKDIGFPVPVTLTVQFPPPGIAVKTKPPSTPSSALAWMLSS